MSVRPGKKFGFQSAVENLQRRWWPDWLRQTVADRCSSSWKGAVANGRTHRAWSDQRWFSRRAQSSTCVEMWHALFVCDEQSETVTSVQRSVRRTADVGGVTTTNVCRVVTTITTDCVWDRALSRGVSTGSTAPPNVPSVTSSVPTSSTLAPDQYVQTRHSAVNLHTVPI